jgi:hypothetical protein
LKDMLVSYLTQQQEFNDLKIERDYYEEQLEMIMKDNIFYLNEEGEQNLRAFFEFFRS